MKETINWPSLLLCYRKSAELAHFHTKYTVELSWRSNVLADDFQHVALNILPRPRREIEAVWSSVCGLLFPGLHKQITMAVCTLALCKCGLVYTIECVCVQVGLHRRGCTWRPWSFQRLQFIRVLPAAANSTQQNCYRARDSLQINYFVAGGSNLLPPRRTHIRYRRRAFCELCDEWNWETLDFAPFFPPAKHWAPIFRQPQSQIANFGQLNFNIW